jgi:hypothetical protein
VRSVHLIGHRRYGGSIYTGDDGTPIEVVAPIISEAKFARVDKVLVGRRRNTKDPSSPTKFRPKTPASLLGGLVRCGDCGEAMEFSGTYPKKGRDYGYYQCRVCRPTMSVRTEVGAHVARQALLFVASLEPGSAIADEVAKRMLATFTPETVTRREQLDGDIEALDGRLDKIRREYLAGSLDEAEWDRLQDDATMRRNGMVTELATLPEAKTDLGVLMDLTQASDDPDGDLVGPGSAWATMPLHRQREILRVLVDEVVIERRPKPSEDIEGRTIIEFATEDNVVELAIRPERRRGFTTAVAVAAS